MKLYGFADTRSTRVAWALEEAGAAYDYVQVDLRKGEARQSAFLEINAGGKVPALVDGELVLTESAAICNYIADKFPASRLAPAPGTADRARFHQWCFFALTELEQPLWTKAKHTFALPEQRRVPAIVETARWEFSRATHVLVAGLGERDYILGDSFTAADILISHTLGWAQASNFEIAPPLLRYAERLFSRPALARARQRERPPPG